MTEPINWGVVASFAVPILAFVSAVFGVLWSARHQRGVPENRLIDQLQEDMRDIRKELAEVKAELKAERDRATRSGRRKDNYVQILRTHIELEKGKPAPEWPPDYDD